MIERTSSKRLTALWQFLFLVLSSTWLWAPLLNRHISPQVSLISQYEALNQPYSWLFRTGDVLGAVLLAVMAYFYLSRLRFKVVGWLLLTIAAGMLLDPLFALDCLVVDGKCTEALSSSYIIHAIETVITASAIFTIGVYDVWKRKRLVSIAFVAFQISYAIFFLTQLASKDHFNTLSQYVYQLLTVLWLAWFCRDYIATNQSTPHQRRTIRALRYGFAAWIFTGGLLATLVSLAKLEVFGHAKGLYFADNTAWLAQHSAIVGIVMIYLSRQLARGERRARQILLLILGLQILKYAIIVPRPILLAIYLSSFCVLFVLRDYFDRGITARTMQVRLKDIVFMLGTISGIVVAVLLLLHRDPRLAATATQAIDHFFDYTITQEVNPRAHLHSALLAHAFSSFLLASVGTVLWILFRPSKAILPEQNIHDNKRVEQLLYKHSTSTEDFFKLWPPDKQYFWADNGNGFIAYKIVGSVAFVLSDPVASKTSRQKLLAEYVQWTRSMGLRACFLPVEEASRQLYADSHLAPIQIGSTAVVAVQPFLATTSRTKWWRWKKNRAVKEGYEYRVAQPPHTTAFLTQLQSVSNAWLGQGGRQEHGFALGYFDEAYLQRCPIHFLQDATGNIIAFTNQLPTFRPSQTVTIDLLRYVPEASDAMPYLLLQTIGSLGSYTYFDLGFVPFASTDTLLARITQTISSGRFSAKGLEQFKNKFDPEWRPMYMYYDGDIADLAVIAMNIEKLMEPTL